MSKRVSLPEFAQTLPGFILPRRSGVHGCDRRACRAYGVGLIFLNVLLDQLGLPVPALPTLIVAGALVADGKLFGPAVLSVTVVASTLADTVWYIAGWRYGNRVMKTLCRISLSPDSCVRQTEARFGRWGASLLLFAKFIPLVAMIAPPLAGAPARMKRRPLGSRNC